jgi:outer membrane lipase/esterase
MRKFRPTLLAGALALALTAGTASAQFSNTYFFGDSLSDSGNWLSTGALPAGTGKFTINPGPVWSEVFASYYGSSATPSTQGGTNYAWGGAQVTTLPMTNGQPLDNLKGAPIVAQVQQFVAKGRADPNALYSLFGGPNEVGYQIGLLQAGLTTAAGVQQAVVQAAAAFGTQAAVLKAAGANYIIVWGMPDLGTTLVAQASGQAATLSQLSTLFNSTLWTTLDASGVPTIRLNSAALLKEILANPSAYGIVNATTGACALPPQDTVALCTASTLASGANPATWFWADGQHASPATHKIMAQYAESMITGPQQMAALGQAPADVERANWRTLDGRMMSAINAPGGSGKLQAWAAYDYADADIFGASLSGNGDLNTISVGADMLVSNKMLAGLQFAYTEYKGNFGNGGGDFKLEEPMFTAYMGYGEGPWYVGATLGAGSLDYSTNRNNVLGAATRNETGNTNGYQVVGRLLGGYWFKYANVDHGPFLKLTYDKSVVRQFSENGNDSTALTYNQQNNDAFWSSLGWQATGNWSGFRPFARATWEYNFNADTTQVSARSNTLSGWYTVPGFEQDDNWGLFDLGVSKDFGGVTGFLSGNASAGKGDGDYWTVTVGIRVPL